MNAVEIEQAITELAEQPFDREAFPFDFLRAFGNPETTIKRLIKGNTNQSDCGGVLQRSNIHIKVCAEGEVSDTLEVLKESPATTKAKAKFILATDGAQFEAEDLNSGETVACEYSDFPNHFGFFLSLAGITTVKQIRDSSVDIRATSQLNKLYVQLLQDNPEWSTAERRSDMNHFMARLIFCFFAEDTDIFNGDDLFSSTIDKMGASDASDTDHVISEIFRAMNTKSEDSEAARIPRWAKDFPYVNGGLFSGSVDVPKFSKMARAYLRHIGGLDWKKINPDIFGSMIQAVADDEERGHLGMHYTNVPNILKVLNPLFLDDLRKQLEAAGDSPQKLLNLRKRIAKIRVFDPACGSGNFLVIGYKEMRAIEAEINKRRGEVHLKTSIPLTNFRGIEVRDFPAEIARLALIIAEYQCDVTYRGQKEALAEFLPLDTQNWITCANALRVDWLSICPPTGTGVKHHADDLFHSPVDQAEIDFVNEGGETYICGNPPYIGDKLQSVAQKSDMEELFSNLSTRWKSFDYICGFFLKAANYLSVEGRASVAFVSTNSICQGVQASQFWQLALRFCSMHFAHTSFPWKNLAAKNAGVMCVIVGLSPDKGGTKKIYYDEVARTVGEISPYLTEGGQVYVTEKRSPISTLPSMLLGNVPKDGGNLIYSADGFRNAKKSVQKFLRPLYGSQEYIKGTSRFCLWISAEEAETARQVPEIGDRLAAVSEMRLSSKKGPTRQWADRPHSFVEIRSPGYENVLIIPRVSSESREYLPIGFLPKGSVVLDSAFALYDAPLWSMSIVASRVHLVWIATVCGKLKTDFRYSNTLGWNTFPLPKLTEKNREDLKRCAEDILLAREAHFPATIADLYDPQKMPDDLRRAHDRNDEVLERIYIGRRFKNDTERLEKLFDLYTKMTTKKVAS